MLSAQGLDAPLRGTPHLTSRCVPGWKVSRRERCRLTPLVVRHDVLAVLTLALVLIWANVGKSPRGVLVDRASSSWAWPSSCSVSWCLLWLVVWRAWRRDG